MAQPVPAGASAELWLAATLWFSVLASPPPRPDIRHSHYNTQPAPNIDIIEGNFTVSIYYLVSHVKMEFPREILSMTDTPRGPIIHVLHHRPHWPESSDNCAL